MNVVREPYIVPRGITCLTYHVKKCFANSHKMVTKSAPENAFPNDIFALGIIMYIAVKVMRTSIKGAIYFKKMPALYPISTPKSSTGYCFNALAAELNVKEKKPAFLRYLTYAGFLTLTFLTSLAFKLFSYVFCLT